MKCIKFFIIVTFTNFQKFEFMPSSYTSIGGNLKKFINVQINHLIKNFKIHAQINFYSPFFK